MNIRQLPGGIARHGIARHKVPRLRASVRLLSDALGMTVLGQSFASFVVDALAAIDYRHYS